MHDIASRLIVGVRSLAAAGLGVDKYHHRSPIILPVDAWAVWLDAGYEDPLSLIAAASAPNAYSVEYVSGPFPD